jgi:WD40 repeat protein
VTTTTLPAAAAPISAGNAASVRELTHLVVGLPRFSVSAGDLLAVRASDDVLIYDLSASPLSPVASANTGWSGYSVAASGDGRYIATLEFPVDFSTPPFAQIRDGASGAPLDQIASQVGSDGTLLAIANFAFNPALPLLAIAETTGGGLGSSGVPTPVVLWDVANNRPAGQLAHPNVVVNLAFSGDGTKLATDSAANGQMIVSVWDMGTQAIIVEFPTTPIIHFMGTPLALNADGSKAAVGYPDGSLHLWQINGATASEQYGVPLFDSSINEVVSAVALSPDGSVIAVAGGVPYSGGLSGTEPFPIILIDAATGTTLTRLEGHGSLIRDLAFTHDGRYLISAGDSSVKFWGV